MDLKLILNAELLKQAIRKEKDLIVPQIGINSMSQVRVGVVCPAMQLVTVMYCHIYLAIIHIFYSSCK